MWWGCCYWPGMRSLFSALGDILQASDNLSRVINLYKTVVEGQVINGEVATSTMPDSEGKMFRFAILDPSRPAPVSTTTKPQVQGGQHISPQGLQEPAARETDRDCSACLRFCLPGTDTLGFDQRLCSGFCLLLCGHYSGPSIFLSFCLLIQEVTTPVTKAPSSTWQRWMHQAAGPQCSPQPPRPWAFLSSRHPRRPQGPGAAAHPARPRLPQGPAPATPSACWTRSCSAWVCVGGRW